MTKVTCEKAVFLEGLSQVASSLLGETDLKGLGKERYFTLQDKRQRYGALGAYHLLTFDGFEAH